VQIENALEAAENIRESFSRTGTGLIDDSDELKTRTISRMGHFNDDAIDLSGPFSGVITEKEYISNKNYFLMNPEHGGELVSPDLLGACGTRAGQMLLGYHNYYSDRRLIPEVSSGGVRFLDADYGNLNYWPDFGTPNGNSLCPYRTRLGTTEAFYNELYDSSPFGILNQWPGSVATGMQAVINTHSTGNVNYSINSGTANFAATALNAMAELDADRPIVLGQQPVSTSAFHFAVAYGRAKIDGTSGYIVHYGWGIHKYHTWTNALWYFNFISMNVTHAHNCADTGNNLNGSHRELIAPDAGTVSLTASLTQTL